MSWIKRYSIDLLNDNWADIIDNFLNLTPDTRHKIHHYGPERFNKIIKADIPVISNLFAAYKAFKHQLPTDPGTMDNSWLNQCAFYNMNITRKHPNTKTRTYLTPTFYGIPDRCHTLTLKDLYPRGTFITHDALDTLTLTNIQTMQYLILKNHIKSHIGPGKKYDAIAKEISPQKMHTHSNSHSLMLSIKKGSGIYRKILARENPLPDIHHPEKWIKKLGTNNITKKQIKNAFISLHSPYLDSTNSDHLSRLKLGKTLFNNQLFAIGIKDENVCTTCKKEFNINNIEDYKHAMFYCPAVQNVIQSICATFFPNLKNNFSIGEILLSVDTTEHHLYTGTTGKKIASLIWDIFQVYILKSRQNERTPISTTAIFEIKTQINRILKILPKSKLSLMYNASEKLMQTIS